MKRFRIQLIGLAMGFVAGLLLWLHDLIARTGYSLHLRATGDTYALTILWADCLVYGVVGILGACLAGAMLANLEMKAISQETSLLGKVLNVFGRLVALGILMFGVGILVIVGSEFTRPPLYKDVSAVKKKDIAQLGLALAMYINDYDDVVPDMSNATAMHSALWGYTKDETVFHSTDSNQLLQPNSKISHLSYNKIARSTVLIYDPVAGTDGKHVVFTSDDTVKRLTDPELAAALAKSPLRSAH